MKRARPNTTFFVNKNKKNNSYANTIEIEGVITSIAYPKFVKDFNGFAKFSLHNTKTGKTMNVSGKLPYLDYAFIYRLSCLHYSTTKRFAKKEITIDHYQTQEMIEL